MNPRYLLAGFLLFCLYSTGCLHSDAPPNTGQPGAGRHEFALTVDGLKRTFTVHVPPGYRPDSPSPLVIMLHGGGGTARATIRETGWTEKADEAGFLAVFPNAVARDPLRRASFAWNPQLWNDGSERFYPDQQAVDDVHFISVMLDTLFARFAIDRRQVFITGFSNGASMSFLAAARLSERIAAIAPVAGACWIDPGLLQQPVPMLYITGNADPLNLIEGGVPKLASGGSDKVRAKPKPPVSDSILKWARALECPPQPGGVSDENGVRTETYGPCRNGAEVKYVVVDGLGHTWAGGISLLPESMVGKTSDRISATEVIWNFFRKHGGSGKSHQPH